MAIVVQGERDSLRRNNKVQAWRVWRLAHTQGDRRVWGVGRRPEQRVCGEWAVHRERLDGAKYKKKGVWRVPIYTITGRVRLRQAYSLIPGIGVCVCDCECGATLCTVICVVMSFHFTVLSLAGNRYAQRSECGCWVDKLRY